MTTAITNGIVKWTMIIVNMIIWVAFPSSSDLPDKGDEDSSTGIIYNLSNQTTQQSRTSQPVAIFDS